MVKRFTSYADFKYRLGIRLRHIYYHNLYSHLYPAYTMRMIKQLPREWELIRLPLTTRRTPTNIFIETTNRCNLKCIMCSRSHFDHVLGSMDMTTFLKLKPLFARAKMVHMHGCGEPLFNKHFLEMVRTVKNEGSQVNFNSNFTLLNQEMARELIDLQVDSITVSLDGATEETYAAIRRGAHLDQVIHNIQLMNEEKKKQRSTKPHMGVEFVAMKRNIHELSAVIRLIKQYDMEWIDVFHVIIFGESLKDETLFLYPGIMRRAFEEARQAAAENGIRCTLPSENPTTFIHEWEPGNDQSEQLSNLVRDMEHTFSSDKVCFEPWRTIYVQWNGDIFPCCYWSRNMGNLSSSSFLDIWNNAEYKDLRQCISTGNLPDNCQNCPMLQEKRLVQLKYEKQNGGLRAVRDKIVCSQY
ncbi:radical SAM protein [bacterium]|nr:radical SAM protein [bacterium]